MSQAYTALESVVTSNSTLLVSMRTDLTCHDQATLTGKDAPARFGWIVNSTSTHLLREDIGVETAQAYDDCFHPADGSCRTSLDTFYLWDGSTLARVSHDEMFTTLEHWRVAASLAH